MGCLRIYTNCLYLVIYVGEVINVAKITKHAEKRVRERSGINKCSVDRVVEIAYRDGLTHGETSGRLNKWRIRQ